MNPPLYHITDATKPLVPIVISVPHSGTLIPDDIIHRYRPEVIKFIDDTDFYVGRLYDFAADIGISLIKANYSRWVIDLNRSPDNIPLYKDGRTTTGLTPTINFLGDEIYKSNSDYPDKNEIRRRTDLYYTPYYEELEIQLSKLRSKFGKALLWDAHSIRRNVPTISPAPFPDFILGSNEATSADQNLIQSALSRLKNSKYTVSHNHPFKGGNITRYFGRPESSIHALQLEMSKDCYMDERELQFDENKSRNIKTLLQKTISSLIKIMMA